MTLFLKVCDNASLQFIRNLSLVSLVIFCLALFFTITHVIIFFKKRFFFKKKKKYSIIIIKKFLLSQNFTKLKQAFYNKYYNKISCFYVHIFPSIIFKMGKFKNQLFRLICKKTLDIFILSMIPMIFVAVKGI